ncbi:unnamed protein product [Kluyveromyces dobzhanskii CBS 2104]|uniref:WGS project CCBQ000000000 data, contig 00014 n=1 Tax=Kluyveromyces dobzhanskii CBS 2104 TaxID=1427455 RepID=A0A0A8L727_9SACH|nr:unnamed protein product [Kluyveromyces dobzhanskii CBS 2104]
MPPKQNLHNAVSKTNAVKALDALVADNKISCKQFGKISIYVRNEIQIQLEDNQESKDVAFEDIQELNEELAKIVAERQAWSTKISLLLAEPSNNDLIEMIEQAHKKIDELDTNIKYLSNTPSDSASDALVRYVQGSRLLVEKESKNRRRDWKSCMQLVKHGIQPKDVNNLLVC